ncbi:MAG: TRAP transporter substrate-binding protein [Caldisericaceae bacterium]|nr:TRAP transporter substrate-binding protein [Caldisericaceae bacterium]
MNRLLLLVVAFSIIAGCQSGSKKIKILKLAHVLDVSHPVHRGMEFLAKRLNELSEGTMRIDIYPSGQLGAERELIELLQIGSLAMTKVSASPMESFVPEMKIFSLPYVFRDDDHLWKVLKSEIGQKLLLDCQKYRIRGLCYYDAGNRSFYTTSKPIYTPEDLRGLKIRVMKSKTSVEMIQSLGGSATPIAWGELYTALQQGVVDGAENNPPSFYLSHHYEVCKYYTLDEHTSIPDVLLISTHIWNSLTRQQQQWLMQAVNESVDIQRQYWKEASEHALKEVEKAGVKIIHPDKALFKQAVKPMFEQFKGTNIGTLIEQIQQLQ